MTIGHKISLKTTLLTAAVGLAACPASFKAFGDARGRLECACVPPWRDYLYGTGIYTDTSSVCAAAQHAGLVGPSGGAIEVIGLKGADSYEGSVQNDVASKRWGAWPRAFQLLPDGLTASAIPTGQ